MFNAVNILEALKHYIHTRGGQSSANNIAEAVNDLNSIPQDSSGISEAPVDGKQYARKDAEWSEVQSSGGDIPDEVSNAVETHGMGWTSEEPVPAINITWDGNIEGKESFDMGDVLCYKVSDKKLTISDLIGSVLSVNRTTEQYTISNLDIESPLPDVVVVSIEFDNADYIILSGTLPETTDGGTYFSRGLAAGETWYITSLTKEASTQEVVHQIDSKYIPKDGYSVRFNYNPDTDELTCNYTPQEVKDIWKVSPVSGYLNTLDPYGRPWEFILYPIFVRDEDSEVDSDVLFEFGMFNRNEAGALTFDALIEEADGNWVQTIY